MTWDRTREFVKDFLLITAYFGLLGGLLYVFKKITAKIIKKEVEVYKFSDGVKFPICIRLNTSDISVYHDIFQKNSFACLSNITDVKFIIDCGGYIGCSAIWFLNNYRNAHIIVIEPDPDNFILCSKNLSYYNQRVTLIHSAVWSYKRNLIVYKGNGSYWSTQVRETKNGEKIDICAVDIDTLIKESGFEKVDILKIDIEKAELDLFSHDYEKWMNKVKNLSIELHNKKSEEVFFGALKKYNYQLSRSGELAVCKNISQKPV